MDCGIAEGMINDYISGTMSDKDLEAFIEHIENCPSCYDELETYFIVHEASRQLAEEDDKFVYDFKGLLHMDIQQRKGIILRKNILRGIASLGIGVTITGFLFYFIQVIIQQIS